jgi:hypothetical protein
MKSTNSNKIHNDKSSYYSDMIKVLNKKLNEKDETIR